MATVRGINRSDWLRLARWISLTPAIWRAFCFLVKIHRRLLLVDVKSDIHPTCRMRDQTVGGALAAMRAALPARGISRDNQPLSTRAPTSGACYGDSVRKPA